MNLNKAINVSQPSKAYFVMFTFETQIISEAQRDSTSQTDGATSTWFITEEM